MRTVIDIRTVNNHFPGIGRYTYQLVRALAQMEDRDELVLLSTRNSNERFNISALASNPNIRIVSTAAPPFSLREQLLLPAELRKLNPALTHFPYMVLPYLAPRPVILTIHDTIPLKLPQFFSLRKRVLYRASLWLALRAAAGVICVSEAARVDLTAAFHLDPSRITVIHEGVGDFFYPRSRNELDFVRIIHRLPDQYLLYVGNNKPHRNLPALIEACSRLNMAPPLVIAGFEDPRYKEAQKNVERLGMKDRVRFLGAVEEEQLPALYSGARAFVFPSLREGFGLPPLESMACGVPVACSKIPSLQETIGDAALFFDPQDPDSIAYVIERILNDEPLHADLRTRGLQRAAELSWGAAAQRTLQAYKAALS